MFVLIEQQASKGELSLAELVELLGHRSHHLMILFLVLPFLQPIPLVGLSTPLGLIICVASILHYFGKPPWVPRRYHCLKIPPKLLAKTVDVGKRLWQAFDLIMRRRWLVCLEGRGFRLMNLLMVASLAFLLALPLPIPFSNTIPAIGIAIHSVAQLREDGVAVVFGYSLWLGTLAFFASLFWGIGWALGI